MAFEPRRTPPLLVPPVGSAAGPLIATVAGIVLLCGGTAAGDDDWQGRTPLLAPKPTIRPAPAPAPEGTAPNEGMPNEDSPQGTTPETMAPETMAPEVMAPEVTAPEETAVPDKLPTPSGTPAAPMIPAPVAPAPGEEPEVEPVPEVEPAPVADPRPPRTGDLVTPPEFRAVAFAGDDLATDVVLPHP